MSGARISALATLRSQIERIETAEVVHAYTPSVGGTEGDGPACASLDRLRLQHGPRAVSFILESGGSCNEIGKTS